MRGGIYYKPGDTAPELTVGGNRFVLRHVLIYEGTANGEPCVFVVVLGPEAEMFKRVMEERAKG